MAHIENRIDTRERIVAAADRLLREQGPAAVTTRGVADAAGVQAPAIYRLFGDKDGLLEAVAEHAMATSVSEKAHVVAAAAADGIDPLDDLAAGWRAQIAFGVANPAVFRLLSDPERVRDSAAARSGRAVLRARIHRIALTGRLLVDEERAVDLIQAAGVGAIHVLLAASPDDRDSELADQMYAAVLARIVADAPARPSSDGTVIAAIALKAAAPSIESLSDGEQRLLAEWLDRVIG